MNLSFLEIAAFWSNIAVVVGGLLAAAGAVFALYYNSRLEAIKDAELGKFQTESRVAIASAEARAAEANEKAAGATATAAHADERAGKREIEAAQQRERAANAQRDLLVLQERTKPRRLSATEQSALTSALKQTTPKGVVHKFNCVLGDGALRVCDTTQRSVASGGLGNRPASTRRLRPGRQSYRWRVWLFDQSASAPPYAAALQKAFKDAGLSIPGAEVPRRRRHGHPSIGNKPQSSYAATHPRYLASTSRRCVTFALNVAVPLKVRPSEPAAR